MWLVYETGKLKWNIQNSDSEFSNVVIQYSQKTQKYNETNLANIVPPTLQQVVGNLFV